MADTFRLTTHQEKITRMSVLLTRQPNSTSVCSGLYPEKDQGTVPFNYNKGVNLVLCRVF